MKFSANLTKVVFRLLMITHLSGKAVDGKYIMCLVQNAATQYVKRPLIRAILGITKAATIMSYSCDFEEAASANFFVPNKHLSWDNIRPLPLRGALEQRYEENGTLVSIDIDMFVKKAVNSWKEFFKKLTGPIYYYGCNTGEIKKNGEQKYVVVCLFK